MMIFRILCGEWIEPLWDCMRAERHEVCIYCYYLKIKKKNNNQHLYIYILYIMTVLIFFILQFKQLHNYFTTINQ